MKPHRGSRNSPLALQGEGPGAGVRAGLSASCDGSAFEADGVIGPPPSVPPPEGEGRSDDSEDTSSRKDRTRKCIATGQLLPEEKLIRFVGGPEGVVVPDLARKLPGRGIWVEATRASVELATKKNAFARAAKAPLKAPADLADQVEKLLAARLLQALGLARRAGELTWGNDRVSSAISSGKVAWMIEAADGAADGRRKLVRLGARQEVPPRLIGAFAEAEIGLALGLENVIHLAFLAGRGAQRWTLDVERLSGFRPLLPESWREEP